MTKFIKKKSVNTALSKFKKFPTIGALLILVVVSTLYSIEFHNPLTITDSNPTILGMINKVKHLVSVEEAK